MKRYFIKRGDFANTWHIVYSDTEKEIPGYDRITLKEARQLISAEKYRRKYDNAFSGYANIDIEKWEDVSCLYDTAKYARDFKSE